VRWGRAPASLAGGLALLLAGALLFLGAVHSPWWLPGLLPALLLGAFLVLFFRNPSRRVPSAPGAIVSPADGRVEDIELVDEPEFIAEPCVRIGIFLSLFNVHVNRSPAAGRVAYLRYRPGKFHDARRALASRENEANSIGLEREDLGGPPGVRILVRQISGAIARRIVCPLEVGDTVARGGLVGMIRYGSRTEIYLPRSAGLEVLVRVGDKVKGGATVLAMGSGRGAR
jgi:phosphatidylserine decarboxylase